VPFFAGALVLSPNAGDTGAISFSNPFNAKQLAKSCEGSPSPGLVVEVFNLLIKEVKKWGL